MRRDSPGSGVHPDDPFALVGSSRYIMNTGHGIVSDWLPRYTDAPWEEFGRYILHLDIGVQADLELAESGGSARHLRFQEADIDRSVGGGRQGQDAPTVGHTAGARAGCRSPLFFRSFPYREGSGGRLPEECPGSRLSPGRPGGPGSGRH